MDKPRISLGIFSAILQFLPGAYDTENHARRRGWAGRRSVDPGKTVGRTSNTILGHYLNFGSIAIDTLLPICETASRREGKSYDTDTNRPISSPARLHGFSLRVSVGDYSRQPQDAASRCFYGGEDHVAN